MITHFKYRARDKFARLVTGAVLAEGQAEAVKKLREMGYVVLGVTQGSEFSSENIFEKLRRVSLEDVNAFTRQLYSLQKAGIPLLSGLEAIQEQTENRYFKRVIGEIIRDIKGGLSFSAALKEHRRIFDDIYVNMIKAAETGGLMEGILERLCGLLEQEIDTRSRIRASTRYPCLAFFVLCLAFLILITFVIPRFAMVYSQFNAALPLPARILIGLNLAVRKFWFLSILGAGALIFGFSRFINSRSGRPLWDNFRLKVPVFGPLVTMLTMSRFARITAVLMRSGVPILETLELVAATSGNSIIKRAIMSIKESVNQGKGISGPMKLTNLFPPAVVQMVAVGEQTGRTDELLLEVADYYDRESGYMIKGLTTYIEPILIFILGIMVLVMAQGIFMPMWNIIKLFNPS